jgi:transposase
MRSARTKSFTSTNGESGMNVTLIGIDLAKTVFQLHGADAKGNAIFKKTLSRQKLIEFMVKSPRSHIVMEACGGANHWARTFKEMGHEVRLISPQFVKPFVKSHKNDRNDAEAIVEAASRPSMRYVSVKTVEQQDMQSLLRLREGCIQMRTKIGNQLRGLLTEYGIVFAEGIGRIRKNLPNLFDRDVDNELTPLMKEMLEMQYGLFTKIDEQITNYDIKIKGLCKAHDICQRVQQLEGIGPITAVALAAILGNPHDFKNGREFAAFLGLVPRQHSSGGREKLLGISKRGDRYLRELLIHGARSVVSCAKTKKDKKSVWINNLKRRAGTNRTCVALANKNARIVLAMLKKNEHYQKAV